MTLVSQKLSFLLQNASLDVDLLRWQLFAVFLLAKVKFAAPSCSSDLEQADHSPLQARKICCADHFA